MPKKGFRLEGKICKGCKVYKKRISFQSKNKYMLDLCHPCLANRSREYRRNNPQKWKEIKRKANLKMKFGITVEEYDSILKKQNGVCAICELKPESLMRQGEPLRLAVDHCHETGKVRGLLCANCNRAIGQLGDSSQRITKALQYLTTEGISSTEIKKRICSFS